MFTSNQRRFPAKTARCRSPTHAPKPENTTALKAA
uniref:Uncharacterized protein n=1 Tax=Anguilla anguilla TaxID=7936 RepID=A0A0E9VXF6_ANGAN